MRFASTLALLLTVLASPAALAQDVVRLPDEVRFRTKTVIEFGQLKVGGEVTKPAATLITSRREARFQLLIRARGDFRPELDRSLDAL